MGPALEKRQSTDAVKALGRVAQMMVGRRASAAETGLDPDVAESIWRSISHHDQARYLVRMESDHLRLGWCVVAPAGPEVMATLPQPEPRPQEIWSVSTHISDTEPGPEEWANWYLDLGAARAACDESSAPGVTVVEISVSSSDAATLLAHDPQSRWWDLRLLREAVPSPRSSLVIGHEAIGGQDLLFEHSWYCFGYQEELSAPPNSVIVNPRGLIQDQTTADMVVAHCQADRKLHGELWVGLRLALA